MQNLKNYPLQELISIAENKTKELSYSDETIRKMRSVWKQFSTYSTLHDCTVFDEQLAASFLEERYNYPDPTVKKHSTYANGAANAVRKLSDLQIHGRFLMRFKKQLLYITPAYRPSVDAYVTYCRKRNIVEDSIGKHQRTLNDFFEHLLLCGVGNPEQINAVTISEYISSLMGYAMKTAERIIFVLRHYFKAGYLAGIFVEDLSNSIPKLHFPKSDKIPVVWDDGNIGNLINAIDRGSPLGKRDYAILQIVIKLGLRDGDVRELKLEDIKWNTNRIEFIQPKTMQAQCLPLLPEVGNSIIDYLKNGRPQTNSPHLFVKHTAPYNGIQKAGNIVTKYLRLAKIQVPPNRKHGIHSLRHSLANRLLAQEVPLEIISGILGHVTINSSKAYMHLDIQNLRKCALEVGGFND